MGRHLTLQWTYGSARVGLPKKGALKTADYCNNLRLKIQSSEGITPETADEFAGLALRPKDSRLLTVPVRSAIS
jgi:hypothetical protein